MFRLAGYILFTVALLVAQGLDKGQAEVRVWAAISIPKPVFPHNRTDDLIICFAIVNDGHSMVNPGVGSSRLFINGVGLADWPMIASNGPGTSFSEALPPGRTLMFAKGMKKYFERSGVYTVRWEGRNFRAPDITFRVLPGDL